MRKQDGFTLVELIVSMAVFILVMAAATTIFIPLVNQFKQQTKIAETNIEGIVGLAMLKADLEQAGVGLPWYFPNDTCGYNEAGGAPANLYNELANNPPRAVVSGINTSGGIVNNSDYLVIKSAGITGNDTAQSWSYIVTESEPTGPRTWASGNLVSGSLANGNRVIVIKPKVSDTRLRELVMDGATFYTTYSSPFPANFSPTQPTEAYLIYGIDPNTPLKMPFNRADYYVSTANVPARCAAGTGVLVKAVMSQQAGVDFPPQNITPLLDCVADMKVLFGLDMNNDGIIGTYSNADGSNAADAGGITGQSEGMTGQVQSVLQSNSDLSAFRDSLMEVRIYILAHEGQRDPGFTFTDFTPGASCPKCVTVGELNFPNYPGRDFDLSAIGDPNYENYRWKVYKIVVKLQNMR
jgi:prepilin-type N-terminal cleavage/methylation domain-containing protein